MLEKFEYCPECGTKLNKGWIGERFWLLWYDAPPKLFSILSLGKNLLRLNMWKNWGWGSREKQEARRCPGCGLVLFKSDLDAKYSTRNFFTFQMGICLFIVIITAFFSFFLFSRLSPFNPSGKLGQLRSKTMQVVTADEGFRYFSGYHGGSHDHPAIYAYEDKNQPAYTVVGAEMEKDFPAEKLDEALAAYKQLLERRGYKPSPRIDETHK